MRREMWCLRRWVCNLSSMHDAPTVTRPLRPPSSWFMDGTAAHRSALCWRCCRLRPVYDKQAMCRHIDRAQELVQIEQLAHRRVVERMGVERADFGRIVGGSGEKEVDAPRRDCLSDEGLQQSEAVHRGHIPIEDDEGSRIGAQVGQSCLTVGGHQDLKTFRPQELRQGGTSGVVIVDD